MRTLWCVMVGIPPSSGSDSGAHTPIPRLRSLIPGILLLGALTSLEAEILYTVTDLGTLGGTYAFGTGINNAGQVTGTSNTSGNTNHAFLYSDGQMIDLGTLGGSYSFGNGINNAGQVTGVSGTSTGNDHAFLYSSGQMMDLGTLAGLAGCCSTGSGINDAGQVTGGSTLSESGYHAFIFRDGQMMDLGALEGSSNVSLGSGINNAGQVTGTGYGQYAFLYSNGQMIKLGTLGGTGSGNFGNAINDAGQITGSSVTSTGVSHAFLYSNGQMLDLGTLGGSYSSGRGINNAGQVVGSAEIVHSEPLYFSANAFLYTNGQMTDLNQLIDPALGIRLYDAAGINDVGQIVATGAPTSDPFSTRAYLLTRMATSCAAPVISEVSATPNVLWPPNHNFVPVSIGYTVDDRCASKCGLSVSSNEPLNGKGDGNTSVDWQVIDVHQVQLRAERAGNGSGRVYTVSVTCTNESNQQSSTKAVQVSVPHDRGR
jgi:probable HAF family extracellular repeat protein